MPHIVLHLFSYSYLPGGMTVTVSVAGVGSETDTEINYSDNIYFTKIVSIIDVII